MGVTIKTVCGLNFLIIRILSIKSYLLNENVDSCEECSTYSLLIGSQDKARPVQIV